MQTYLSSKSYSKPVIPGSETGLGVLALPASLPAMGRTEEDTACAPDALTSPLKALKFLISPLTPCWAFRAAYLENQ